MAKPARQARKGRLVLKVRREKRVHRGQQGLPANAAKLDRKDPQVRPGRQDLPGRRAIRGLAASFRVVTGTDNAQCADNEILVALVCATSATDGGKCATPGAAAAALCARK